MATTGSIAYLTLLSPILPTDHPAYILEEAGFENLTSSNLRVLLAAKKI